MALICTMVLTICGSALWAMPDYILGYAVRVLKEMLNLQASNEMYYWHTKTESYLIDLSGVVSTDAGS